MFPDACGGTRAARADKATLVVMREPQYIAGMPLTNEQELALGLLRQGLSTAQAAERLGLPRPTVWRWQHELPEFAGTVPATGGGEARAPLTLRDFVRIAMPLLMILLAALFFYLGH